MTLGLGSRVGYRRRVYVVVETDTELGNKIIGFAQAFLDCDKSYRYAQEQRDRQERRTGRTNISYHVEVVPMEENT